jgi:hypothetical protein
MHTQSGCQAGIALPDSVFSRHRGCGTAVYPHHCFRFVPLKRLVYKGEFYAVFAQVKFHLETPSERCGVIGVEAPVYDRMVYETFLPNMPDK